MLKTRTSPFVMEPLGSTATTVGQVREMLDYVFTYSSREKFDKVTSVTLRCQNNEVMSKEFAHEIYRSVIEDLGVPVLRVISPPLGGAAHLYEAARARPETLRIFSTNSDRTARQHSQTLENYLESCRG